ncbi:MAG TPA: sn-glycerol-3-phosphate ABC transporter ATP-binding protein UgpC [Xanthobacteraceae bacterium]|nr:sn-glycerol-3-phosphate ABC transporter ATP-binding protein UgpC [Xanthobacteraceae bacterium]
MVDVALRNVSKVYAGGVTAVRDISFIIPDGGFCVLVGPSGCGKSTLLRMVAGLETITAGEVLLGGEVVNAREPAERDIAMVFQNYALYPHMSVYDNMAYGLRNRKMPKPEIDKRVRETARMLEIADFLKRKPRELSGGQRQRVAMGRAIVRQPKAFLFDEPLSNLDAKLRVSMRVEIRKLQRAFATTSIYVTHDQLEAMTLADLLVVMNAGRVEQIGPPLEVYERPATTFVAAFIGAPPMNLLRVSAAEAATLAPGLTVPQEGGVIGVRPDELRLASTQDGPPGGLALDLTVTAVERVGPECFVYGAPGAGRGDVIVRVPGTAAPALGEHVRALAGRDRLHLFSLEGWRLP